MQVSLVLESAAGSAGAPAEKVHAYPARHGRRRRRIAAAPLAGALGCVLAFAYTYWFFVLTPSGQRIENTTLLAGRPSTTDSIAGLLRDVDFVPLLGVTAVVLPLLALARRRYALAGGALVTLLGSLAAAQFLKLSVLPRPELGESDGAPGHNSFPSGHVTAAIAVLLSTMLVLPRRFRLWAAVPGALGVAWVAASTVVLGWHRLSDTLGAVFLVSALCCLAIAFRGSQRAASFGAQVTALLVPVLVAGIGYLATTAGAEGGGGVLVMAVVLAAVSSVVMVTLVTWLMLGDGKDKGRHRVQRP
ncbi:phosphatase PAP2 family protein [Amycolatopsis sp. YIM 10]|uniref:phosphatase PAP2 family protein n=1 Tax=Amycolatopsis sp. YIM 10 TaxID=2653857 RepID=UPI0018837A93|nr:phosphatase PAP2 family protein [Amycolatopsis sp. YIM 10]